ncbi:unannotated protein [freshwater metagenome]|uniref:Unannotated protein n=1 Tax=freshwater metagenome TaxID=449393 RepID=A0A6J7NHX5_9ZZZZ
MHADHGYRWCWVAKARICVSVEQMPRTEAPGEVGGLDEPGPARIEAGQTRRRDACRVDHQAISMTAAFSPDPIPMQATRWPATRS